ncbi:ATP-binding protein [Sphingobacterium sp. KU25419]|nr:ATP-binding protein [Sphingobacterium sp. KU25419]
MINAVKFSHSDSHITLHLYQDQDWAVVEIIDTGIGMNIEAQQQLQQQIFSQDVVTPMRQEGKGLGLWVVYHFIRSHHGEFFSSPKNMSDPDLVLKSSLRMMI